MKYGMVLVILLFSGLLRAQSFMVEKVSGRVLCQRGSGEAYQQINPGEKLSQRDFILTMDNSMVLLKKDGDSFLMKGNSALGLNYIKKISTDELLLALAMEDIRNVPKGRKRNEGKTTAVYGKNSQAPAVNAAETKSSENKSSENKSSENKSSENKSSQGHDQPGKSLGQKRINGARLLAENGFRESSVIAARETFRKYPETKNNPADRIYFAEVLEKLNLNEEALAEYSSILSLELQSQEKQLVQGKIRTLGAKVKQ